MSTGLHAKNRPPSSAERWLACPNSVKASRLYPRDDSDASMKGDEAHDLLESCIAFGIRQPQSEDPDLNDSLALVMEWIAEQRKAYPGIVVYPEQRFDIPETGEFGTADITIVSPALLHIVDYKNGYVEVEIRDKQGNPNPQTMNYLCGAIAKYGKRPKYLVTVIQPNYPHIDGPIRTIEVTEAELDAFRQRVAWAIATDAFIAGRHCKKTYCEHRGACASFLTWAEQNATDAWHPAEVNSMDDDRLSKALDHAETLNGLRGELRKEALRRIMSMDRRIPGYKVVKGRRDREITDAGEIKRILLALGATENDLYERKYADVAGERILTSMTFVSAAGVERFIKAYAQRSHLPRGGWLKVWENTVQPYIREYTGGLTLERATDARPAHTRGSEFGALPAPGSTLTHTV